MQSSSCICVALGVIEALWYSQIFHRLDRLLPTTPHLNTIASWQWESKMADTNPPDPIPIWFIASIAAVLVIIIVELATVAALAILIYRNWRWDDTFWGFFVSFARCLVISWRSCSMYHVDRYHLRPVAWGLWAMYRICTKPVTNVFPLGACAVLVKPR